MKGNFKVRCIRGYHGYTTSGKVYEVVNGKLTYDNGRKCFGDYYSVGKLNKNMESQFELVTDNKEITIRQKGRKVTAVMTEDGKYVKSAKAKCSPTDVYDFEVGAKLAFSRLMGEDLTVKEIEVAHSGSIDWEGFKQGKFAVHCDTKEKARQFLKDCDEHGIKWCTNTKISDQKKTRWDIYKNNTSYGCDSFGGLMFGTFDNIPKIDYTPSNTIREVKRPAKVGEWIKVVESNCRKYGVYFPGDIILVDKAYDYSKVVDGVNRGTVCRLLPDEYVVLENYQPEATKALSDYTDKELIDELARRLEDKQ